MKPELQRIAIAEVCGWAEAFPPKGKPHELTKRGGILLPYHWVQEGTGLRRQELPDYLNDLNAMHEAEKVLTEEQLWDYLSHLFHITAVNGKVEPMQQVRAKAAQRAEAFLRTLNLWADDRPTP